ncbi:MAG: hypothetical protein LBB43_06080 [Spirochaetaceae bacterium]|jgi:hypothetical protein|nr:hypothetical protein [Spirochaetaceae bacterium]
MKKIITAGFLACLLVCMAGCPSSMEGSGNSSGSNGDTPDPAPEPEHHVGQITFFNSSSYHAIIHQDAFSGPVLLELSSGQSKKIDVRPSDNYGIGSTFSIEYRYAVVDGLELASGTVWADSIDPDVQLNIVVEANKSYTLQIPQPKNLELTAAFIKILNASDIQFELHYKGTAFKQAGNGNLPVPAGKTGVYQFAAAGAGKAIHGYTVHSTFQSAAVPDFTAKNSYIYDFTYNGASVVKTGEHKIVF